MILNEIKTYVENNDLKDKTICNFYRVFSFYKRECGSDEERRLIEKLDEHGFTFSIKTVGLRASAWPEWGYRHIVITLQVNYKGQDIGEYIHCYGLDGSSDDELIYLYPERVV